MPDHRPVLDIHLDDVLSIARLMDSYPAPWWICGGWAIDLYLGMVTRRHEDLEIGVARADQGLLHDQASGWSLFKITDGEIVDWPRGEWLQLPIHQVVVRNEGANPPEFEFFLNEVKDDRWHFRRDPQIHLPLGEAVVQSPAGVPVMAPQVQLLHKARYHREKDDHDFRTALPHLDSRRRTWLRLALQRHVPGDRWIEQLSAGI
jgi:hypothetical protein